MDSPPPYSKVCSSPSGVGKVSSNASVGSPNFSGGSASSRTFTPILPPSNSSIQFFHPIRLKWTVQIVNRVFLPTLLLRMVLLLGSFACYVSLLDRLVCSAVFFVGYLFALRTAWMLFILVRPVISI
uniref:Uncharacterized protein n=2 Tax=Meloidogyne TaxID=189290 RepID=A0A6V7TSU9_MELEN|nr:unnamed protein product [Meloidogyne enterolobii]